MRTFACILFLSATGASAFVTPSPTAVRTANAGTRLNALLEDLTGRLVGGASGVSLPSVAMPDAVVSSVDPTVLLMGGVAVLALAAAVAAAAATSSSGNRDRSESATSSSSSKARGAAVEEPEPVDVSVPYNAAALLAYRNVVNPDGTETDDEFRRFEVMYKEMAVAEVVLKRKERQVRSLQEEFLRTFPTAAVNGSGRTVNA